MIVNYVYWEYDVNFHAAIYDLEVGDIMHFLDTDVLVYLTDIDRDEGFTYETMWMKSNNVYAPTPGKFARFSLKELNEYFNQSKIKVLKVVK